jgi:hypothetical protein
MNLAVMLACLALAGLTAACRTPLSAPSDFNPEAYRPVPFEDLLTPGRLAPGDKVAAPAYFWQELNYDPAMVRQYVQMAGHPRPWRALKWYAVYGSPQMHGYYDRVVMAPEQFDPKAVKRLDQVRLYGEMGLLGGSQLYLRVHRLEKIVED